MVVPSSALRFATFSSIITLCLCSAQARAEAGAGGTANGGSGGATASSGAGGASDGGGGTSSGGTSSGGSDAGGSTAAGGTSAGGSASAAGGMSGNLIKNGSFDGTATDPWWKNASTSVDPPADMSMAVTNGQLCATIVNGGKNPWDVIIGYSGLPLVKGQAYHIKFSITADVARKVKFKTGLGVDPYSDYFIEPFMIDATAKTIEYTYMNLRDDTNAQFQFQIGHYGGDDAPSAGTVCVDDIVVEPVATPMQPPYTTSAPSGHPFKEYTKIVKMGTAVDTPIFLSNPLHNSIVAGEFAMITPANSMKMNLIQPKQGMYDFTDTDALAAWAKASGLEFRGHPLVWHTQAPGWLTSPKDDAGNAKVFTKDEMIAIMYDHIDKLMSHYKGQFKYWDVVNEAIDNTDYRQTFWYNTIGKEFIDLAFQRAHAADPDAKLVYNDYNIEQKGNAKGDRVFEFVKDLKDRGIPINAIGFQGHYFVEPDGTTSNGVPDMQAIRDNMARYKDIGIEVQITECDFRIGKPLDDTKQQLQNKFYADMLQACIDAENCDHFTVWGLSDLDSWVPSTFPAYDYAHLFDTALKPKADYTAMAQVFAKYPTDSMPAGTGGAGGAGGAGGSAPVAPAAPASSDSGGCSISSSKTGSALWLLSALGAVGALVSRRRKSTRG
ncbi:MAG TPA: endo-1,4-beta-xylanase [Polyangiaceae bacterium]|nr:endo-1,4-beta-xylanase [Polyangiaceae bacterium]